MILLIFTIVLILIFETINGLHDCANSIATCVSTKALSSKKAIIMSAVMNLFGALVVTAVAKTVWSGILTKCDSPIIIFVALLSAISWGLITWYFGMPSSSSHALIGGLVGAAIFVSGPSVIKWSGVMFKVVIPALLSPLIGFVSSFFFMEILGKLKIKDEVYGKIQIFSAAFMSFSHGSNDAQKSMGLITLTLVSAGFYSGTSIPLWVILLCSFVMAVGTSIGGWRIMETMGEKITKLTFKHGFASETSSALTIQIMTAFGAPISTTHCISSAIVGAGAEESIGNVNWKTVMHMVNTWILTVPATILLSFVIFKIIIFWG
jgi:PiT family inorganic phosphate transporter